MLVLTRINCQFLNPEFLTNGVPKVVDPVEDVCKEPDTNAPVVAICDRFDGARDAHEDHPETLDRLRRPSHGSWPPNMKGSSPEPRTPIIRWVMLFTR